MQLQCVATISLDENRWKMSIMKKTMWLFIDKNSFISSNELLKSKYGLVV